jgi:hypothetical protein
MRTDWLYMPPSKRKDAATNLTRTSCQLANDGIFFPAEFNSRNAKGLYIKRNFSTNRKKKEI